MNSKTTSDISSSVSPLPDKTSVKPDPSHSSPTVAFKTIGCRLNQAETTKIEEIFNQAGYRTVAADEPCDVAVINSCTITHGAERDSARAARRLRRKGAKIVILAGCAVEHNGEQLKKLTSADIIANQKDKFNLPQIVADYLRHKAEPQNITETLTPVKLPATNHPLGASAPCVDLDGVVKPSGSSQVRHAVAKPTRALVKAQDGCNFRCSYCIVPDTRGMPRSIPLNQVLDDIRHFADQGVKEIVITGANIGCYHDGKKTLVNLLEAAEQISGIERIRISSIESTTSEREVIDFMASSEKLCNFLHLPLQSGDNTILKRMRRHYTREDYRKVVEYAIDKIPLLGLGADIIVGFPGEDDAAFQNTLRLVEELPFTNLHIFSYSKRAGTPAAEMPNQIDPLEKKERSAQLIALGNAKRQAFADAFIGKKCRVLVEKISENGTASGWTEEYLQAKLHFANLHTNEIIEFTTISNQNDTLLSFDLHNSLT